MKWLNQILRKATCYLTDCQIAGTDEETLHQLEVIPERLDRIIEQHRRNNIVEQAYLRRQWATEGGADESRD